MKRFVLALLVAAGAVPSFAQPTDYSVTLRARIDGDKPALRVAVGQSVYYTLEVRAFGPADPEGVFVELDVPGINPRLLSSGGLPCSVGDTVRCAFGPEGAAAVLVEARVATPGTHIATARVIHPDGHPDRDPRNDMETREFEAFALPSLEIFGNIGLPLRVEPGLAGTFSLSVLNRASTPATNVVVTASLPAGGTITGSTVKSGSATCGITNNDLVCTTAVLAQDERLDLEVSMVAPLRMDGADLVVRMRVTSAEEDVDPTDNEFTRSQSMIRQFVVSNVQDEGSGSLRQAMLDANIGCVALHPCAILFRIPAPVPSDGWFTIQPHTPLPEVTGTLTIDGRTQTLFTGDTNPDGPEIEINGALAGSSAGLRLRPHCDMEVRNLAVNGFPGFGIEVGKVVLTEPCGLFSLFFGAIVRENYLGTDPRGRIAKPNHRGLGLFASEAFVYSNVISGNRRAGVYAENGSYYDITGNRIGIGTDGAPLGNGAGIFVNMGSRDFTPAGADIRQNVIAYNDGMAVARTRRGEIYISRNSMFDNLQQGIDVDLDGPNAQRADDFDVPNAPVLFSAAYDPARNATIVRGRIDSETAAHSRDIELFASSRLSVWATPQAERWVATESLLYGHQDFEIVVPEDLRGKWITATYNGRRLLGFARRGIGVQSHRESHPADTSELSNAVMVQ
jgi:uncharacterized repeat protein (TIGR01451 family)